MKNSGIKRCKFCGKEIGIIEQAMYRKIVVDAEAVWVAADPEGEEYIRMDGSTVKAMEKPIEEKGEWAYRPHRWSCR